MALRSPSGISFVIDSRVLLDAFARLHGCAASGILRAPGRVNLIGEHTDYNDGFVLPMAIDRYTWIALRPRDDGRVRLRSLDLETLVEFALADERPLHLDWGEYVRGVSWALRQEGYELRGWDGLVASDVPIGAGLSSSAALEVAVARAFCQVSGIPWQARSMALLAQRAENEWVGLQCGAMDQIASACCRSGHALLLDCRDLSSQDVPIAENVRVLILDTGTRRSLSDSRYNQRREECDRAAAALGTVSLRTIGPHDLARRSSELDSLELRRARHVVTENVRVRQAATALRDGDGQRLGQLMNASHDSLRHDFDVSTPALDTIVQCARASDACLGARMTGAGFGGCAVALVRAEQAQQIAATIAADYQAATGIEPAVYVCQPSSGCSTL
jgi:galactokinase